MKWPTDIANTPENLEKAKSELALALVIASHDKKLDPIEEAYVDFVGTEQNISAATIKALKDKTAAEIKEQDIDYNTNVALNNGVAKDGDDDVVYFFSAVDLYLEKCYEKKFDTLKAVYDAKIADKFAAINKALDDADASVVAPNHHKYYETITNVGKAFYDGMEASIAWRFAAKYETKEVDGEKVTEEVNQLKEGEYFLGFYMEELNPTLAEKYGLKLSESDLHAYIGNTRKEKYESAKEHLGYCLEAVNESGKQSFDGFFSLLDKLNATLADTTKTDDEKAAYVAELSDVEYIKDVIRNAYLAAKYKATGSEKLFGDYKFWAINQVALIGNKYVENTTVERQQEAGNNLLGAYMSAIAKMEYKNYNYEADTDEGAEALVKAHFEAIVKAFEDVLNKIPDGSDVKKLVDYETAQLTDAAIKANLVQPAKK